ncbi:MAG: hypothetical protein WBF17_08130 [Phycisphaerae bacterium]
MQMLQVTRGVSPTLVAWALAGAVLVCHAAGCTSERDWSMIGRPEDYPHVQTHDGVSVAVEPWTRDEDLRAAFRKPPGRDVLAVRVILFNQGPGPVRFSSTQAKLRLPDGTEVSPLPVSEVSKRLEANEGAAGAIIVICTLGYGGAIAQAVSAGTAEDNWKAQRATRSCSMTLALVDPGEALAGFLCYQCPGRRGCWVRDYPQVEFRVNRMPRPKTTPLSFAVALPLSEKENR